MATQAAVDVLMTKGEFEPQVALAIAGAVAITMTEAQVVTVPVLDARLAALDTRFAALDHKIEVVRIQLENKIDGVRTELDGKSEDVRTTLEAKIESVRTTLEAKIESLRTTLEAKIEVAVERLEKVNEATKAELVRWVFIAMVGSVFLQGMAAAIVNALMRH